MMLYLGIGALFVLVGILILFYIIKNPSNDFVFIDLKVYALGVIFITGGLIYILDKLAVF